MAAPLARPQGWLLRSATLSYLGVMVVLPLAALAYQSASGGGSAFLAAITDRFAVHALKLTFTTAAIMVVINVVMGTATAWVLVRYSFPGKSIVNALIDLPFSIPTVVAGLMLVVLFGERSTLGAVLGAWDWQIVHHKPGVILALLFVTYPFVVRSVQPVLMELEAAEEEAAATLGAGPWLTFRRVTLPTLWPSILTGAALAFSRALGEFGSVVIVAGNQLSTKTAPLYIFGEIESGNEYGAMVVSTVLLASSLAILIFLNRLQRRGANANGH